MINDLGIHSNPLGLVPDLFFPELGCKAATFVLQFLIQNDQQTTKKSSGLNTQHINCLCFAGVATALRQSIGRYEGL